MNPGSGPVDIGEKMGHGTENIIDISPLLSPQTPVWPGDTPLSRKVEMRLENGDSVELSSLNSTVHIGAHADAPSHFQSDAPTIDQVSLEPYIGPCQVVEVYGQPLIQVDHCQDAINAGAKRILFKTYKSSPSQDNSLSFKEDFTAFSPEAVEFMGKNNVILIGIDTPSVDPFSSKTLPAHNTLWKYGIRNLEGLDLQGTEPGTYELIALPLKLQGFDASPVRAILKTTK